MHFSEHEITMINLTMKSAKIGIQQILMKPQLHIDKKVVTFISPKEKMTPLHFEVTRLNVKCQLHWTLIQALVSLRSR